MPPPDEAFLTAADYLRRAAELGEGKRRARSLKGQAEALGWAQIAGVSIDEQEMVGIARQALQELDPVQDMGDYIALFVILKRAEHSADDPSLTAGPIAEAAKKLDPDQLVRQLGLRRTVQLFQQQIGTLVREFPSLALDLCDRLRPSVKRLAEEEVTTAQLGLELQAMSFAYGRGVPQFTPSESLDDLAGQAERRAVSEVWTSETLAATRVGIAMYGPNLDQERIALPLLEQAERDAPELAQQFAFVLSYLRHQLFVGLAVNAIKADNPAEAIDAYFRAFAFPVGAGFPSLTLNILRRIEDLMEHATEKSLETIIAQLATHALRIEQICGRNGTELIQSLCLRVSARMSELGTVKEILVILLLQIAKGLGFGAALLSAREYERAQDETGQMLLDEIAQLESDMADRGEDLDEGLLEETYIDEHLLLTAYGGDEERQAQDSDVAVLENLQHRYDAHLEHMLRGNLTWTNHLFRSTEQLQEYLDSRSVLIAYMEGMDSQGRASMMITLLSDQKTHLTSGSIDFPSARLQMEEQGRKVTLSPFALGLKDLRERLINEDFYPRNLSQELADRR
jgi:hypothetical protein